MKNKAMTNNGALLKALVLATGLATIFLIWRFTPAKQYVSLDNVRAISQWADSLGWIAPVLFIVFYSIGTVLLIPGSVMGALGGITFGVFQGLILVSIGTLFGSSLAFLTARYLARPLVEKLVSHRPAFIKIDNGIVHHGWKMVAVVRLLPVFPYMFINYILGLTKIPFKTYALVTFFTMIPANFALCLASGSLVSGGDDWKRIFLYLFAAGFLLTLLALLPGFLKKKLPEDLASNIKSE